MARLAQCRCLGLLPVLLLPALLLTACDGGADTPAVAPQASETEAPPVPAPVAGDTPLPVVEPGAPNVTDFADYSSKDCATVVRRYTDSLRAGAFDVAALAWADPTIDAARLKEQYAGYRVPAIAAQAPEVEGAAGSLYCTVKGTLTDAGDAEKKATTGELQLRRVNDVDGATPAQLRWTIRSSTFITPLERSPAE